ncbi:MAG: hypothetical protein U1E05_11315 [Patescibacteria group bacterium]|nr:hypothetical protein [Patescibacteria group bacterium]
MLRFWPVFLLAASMLVGCGGSPVDLAPVQGTIAFEDGTVPQGEVMKVYFEPVADGPQAIKKVASGDIAPDGSFQLMTRMPGDGVIPGKYKVFFTVERTYLGQESLLPARFTSASQTPFEVVVEAGKNEPFSFTLQKQ